MSRRILVVEDERMMQTILRDNLECEGYRVSAVTSGEEALEAAGNGSYDAMLLDVMLPGMCGLEVCRQLRKMGRAFPIIMISARNSHKDQSSGLAAGADYYIGKPFSIRDLLLLLESHLDRLNSA